MKKIVMLAIVLLIGLVGLTYISVNSTSEKFKTCEILDISEVKETDFTQYDSVVVAANTLYEGDWLKKIMQGEQYRDAWSAPIRVPIIYLDTLLGGLKVIEQGGGMQTHSLELADNNGVRYSLRSITKDPSKLIPEAAEKLGLENIVVDGISAQHPYSALVVAELSEAAKIIHTHPKVYFVPEQSTLGKHNDKYGNRLFFLEYETEGDVNWTDYTNVRELADTDDIQEWKSEGKPIILDYPEIVRARLFDLIIGDWDRHAKQWGWAIEEKEDKWIAHPIAGDRDNAFFKQDGVIPYIISNELFLPEVQSYEEDIEHMPGLVQAFDVYFLKSVPEETFIEQAKLLQETLNDSVINNAFRVWPENIYELNGEEIKTKLIARREGIVEYAKIFKQILDERELEPVVLNGSEDLELSEKLSKCFDCLD
ncbi:hypothetical protein [Flagellimonas chongwuensis]|nr:hypothetical protein [Allomuricauda chongwuensis]